MVVSQGSIEVICGPMFSGKTEELIRRIRRAEIARQKVQLFKPSLDVRYSSQEVVSHSALSMDSRPVDSSMEILSLLKDSTRIVAIDEVQFFDDQIVTVVRRLANRGLRVICAGLDLDSQARPFGPMPFLLAIADQVQKIQAICTICGAPANRSQRLNSQSEQFLLGAKDVYEARCRSHFEADEDNTFLPLLDSQTPQQSIGQ